MMSKMIVTHLGMGDSLICLGMACFLSLRHSCQIIYPVKHHNVPTILDLIKGWDIQIYAISDDTQMREVAKRYDSFYLGMFNEKGDRGDFPVVFYKDAGIDYDISYKYFPKDFSKIEQLPVPEGNYVFMHEGGSSGEWLIKDKFKGPPYEIIKPDPTISMAKYINIIKNAKEIHVIDSSWIQLIDRVETTGELYFHQYARGTGWDMQLKKDWIYIHE